jgi:hypothetical protein
MTVIIDKANAGSLSAILSDKLKKRNTKGNLVKHFGSLKRGFDGMNYQL